MLFYGLKRGRKTGISIPVLSSIGVNRSSWPGTVIPRWRTSSSSRAWVSKASVFRFVSRTVCSPYPTLNLRRPSFSSCRSTAAYHVHLLRQFLSSAVAWRHTSSNSVTRNYCCRAREVTLSFMDTLITLTYLLVHKALDSRPIFMALASNVQALEARAAVALTIFWSQTHPQT